MIFNKIIRKIRNVNKQLELQRFMNAEILAYSQISGLLSKKYLPITEYSLSSYTIAHILNDILINNRIRIVEFGSGISTVFISELILKYKLETKLLSFDHDIKWQNTLREMYLNENCNGFELIHAPLKNTANGVLQNQQWYDESIVNNKLKGGEVDLVIIDGPPGDVENEYARYPAVNIVENFLSKTGSVLVDDISRPHEQRIVKDLQELGFIANFSLRHCMLSRESRFNTNPYGKALY